METIEASQQGAKQALSILRSCGVRPGSEDPAVRLVLNACLRISGRPPDATRPGGQREVRQEPTEEISRRGSVESPGRSAA
jgi:hypothetical protein